MTLEVRPATQDDDEAIRAVHLAAFPTAAEAGLVEAIDADGDSVISLVAIHEDVLVGHILLSRMAVEGDDRAYRALGLAPVAVLPDLQRIGIGKALVDAAMAEATRRGEELVFVLGEPGYYGRFGFSTAAAVPFASPYAGPYFMARSLGAPLPEVGRADYAPAFASLG